MSVVVATFGADEWLRRGSAKAEQTRRQLHPGAVDVNVVHCHADSLAVARNLAGYDSGRDIDWLCFLDADDDLEPGYLEVLVDGAGDLRAPAFRLGEDLVDLTGRDIDTMNPCVIGTLIRRDLFIDAGGFWHERAWEDWSLFRRAWLLGAEIVHHPDAIYHAATRPESRNSTVDRPEHLHRDIRAAHTAWLATR